MKEFKDMTLTELKELKQQWWKDAHSKKKVGHLAMIARRLGMTKVKMSRYRDSNLDILVDDIERYIKIILYNNNYPDGKIVVDSRLHLYIPGEWENLIRPILTKARSYNKVIESKEHKELVQQLTLL
jgi:hypothetical protein